MVTVRKSVYFFDHRVVCLGAEAVGKTSLLRRFLVDNFDPAHKPTTEDHYQHVVREGSDMYVCLFLDTSGSKDFPAMRKLSISKGNSFLIVFAIDRRESFLEAKRIYNELQESKAGTELKVMLVGNKLDKAQDRCVTTAEALDYARSLSTDMTSCQYVETSSKTGQNVKQAICGLLSSAKEPDFCYNASKRRASEVRSSVKQKFATASCSAPLHRGRSGDILSTVDSAAYCNVYGEAFPVAIAEERRSFSYPKLSLKDPSISPTYSSIPVGAPRSKSVDDKTPSHGTLVRAYRLCRKLTKGLRSK